MSGITATAAVWRSESELGFGIVLAGPPGPASTGFEAPCLGIDGGQARAPADRVLPSAPSRQIANLLQGRNISALYSRQVLSERQKKKVQLLAIFSLKVA
jgi:hypothetical protein